MNNKTKGFIYGAIAAASYGMNPLFALPLYAAGMKVSIPFYSTVISLPQSCFEYSDENAASITLCFTRQTSCPSHYGIAVLFLHRCSCL